MSNPPLPTAETRSMSLYQYGTDFFAYQQIGSMASARAVAPFVLRHLRPRSVLDVGCGAGAWVAAYRQAGASTVMGVDGDYVRRDQLLFDPARFRAFDVAKPFSLGQHFDLAQCLEVAEHLDPAGSETLVDNLVAHAPIVVFSAAPPGQGGENHVNERPYEYWRDLFDSRGYSLFDFLRPRFHRSNRVEHWYRYNMLVFVRHDAIANLSPSVASTRVDPHLPVPDHAPMRWRVRRAVLSRLPVPAVTWMASVKHAMVLRRNAGARLS
jgi:SAM-dependent methyltransferase